MENNTERNEQIIRKKSRKKQGLFHRTWILLSVLIVVLAATVFSTMEDSNYFSSLRRWLMYGDGAQTQNLYTYTSHQSNRCVLLGDDLLLVNPNNIQLLRQGGTILYDLQTNMHSPMISVGSKLAAVCDTGGNIVYILNHTGLLWTHTAASGQICYSARMNTSDYLTVIEQKSGYKASVIVYNSSGEPIFRFDSHDNYLSDAIVTNDGKHLIVVALEAKGGAFLSNFIVYNLSTAERVSTSALYDGLVLDLTLNKNEIISLCDRRLVITTSENEQILNYAYGERYLHNYALTGDDFCTLLLGRYQSSNICQLVNFDMDGTQLATLDLTEEVLDMNASGDYLAVLYSDSLVIYDRTLNEIARLDGTDYAGQVQMNKDGTALLAAETSAWRFLP
ncbi:MAG: hypothetical protein IJ955_03525 [Oscillospiraceae bacterium]|nr:hypothetical protein [Oscillospiraceae bacterium]